MDVLFAPDWRNSVPYQRLLAGALAAHGMHAGFLSHYSASCASPRPTPISRKSSRSRSAELTVAGYREVLGLSASVPTQAALSPAPRS